MLVLLGIVEDVFTISNRGTVIVLALTEGLDPSVRSRVRDKIQLRGANGLVVDTWVRGIELLTRLKHLGRHTSVGILLPEGIGPAPLSNGMEIWLVRDDEETA